MCLTKVDTTSKEILQFHRLYLLSSEEIREVREVNIPGISILLIMFCLKFFTFEKERRGEKPVKTKIILSVLFSFYFEFILTTNNR